MTGGLEGSVQELLPFVNLGFEAAIEKGQINW
jgi:hypothetical protein